MTYIHKGMHTLRDLETFQSENRLDESSSPEHYKEYLDKSKILVGRCLEQVALIFTSITGTHCRAAVKLSYDINGKLHFYTYTRDNRTLEAVREMDNKRVRNNHDPHEGNPTFAAICDSSAGTPKLHFFCNDLEKINFSSTSFTAYNPEYASTYRRRQLLHRFSADWPLPYRSCVSCTIRQGPIPEAGERQVACLGFLSVDSESRNVFDERWDVQIVFAFSDALFSPLKRIIEAQRLAEARGYRPRG